jgi:hypothetical protein
VVGLADRSRSVLAGATQLTSKGIQTRLRIKAPKGGPPGGSIQAEAPVVASERGSGLVPVAGSVATGA